MASGFNLTAELNLRGPSNIPVIIADIKKQLGTVNADVKFRLDPNAAKNTAALNSALTGLNKTLGQTTTTASSAAAAIRGLGAAISSVKAGGLAQNLGAVSTTTTKVSQSMSQVNRQISSASSEMVEFGKQSGLAIRRFAAFSTVTGVVYSLTNAITQGIRAYVDYDRQLIKLQQVTGQSAAGLKSLEQTITQLATGLGVGSAELTEISSTLAQAGLSARDTERALKALALSALAPSFDSMNETVEGSIALMRQFGISASELEQSLGSINAVAAKFAVEAADLITAIQRTGGVFATASRGVSEGTDALNEFLAVFTSVRATTRESAETIATGLRTIFTRIQRGDTINALKEYGVNLTDIDGKFVGAYKAVQLLSEGLSSIDPRDLRFSKIVEELGGFRQIGKVIPLIQQFSTAQEALKVAQTGQGSLAADAAKAQQSLAIQTAKVREEFLALFRDIGKSDSFQAIAKGALSLTSALIKTADSIKGVIPVLGVMLAFKGASAITRFGSGFFEGIRKGPDNRIGKMGGGVVRRFATGGLVPGSGDTDSVPAMLTPGEFVMNKQATKAIGSDKLHSINRRSRGGAIKVAAFRNAGPVTLETLTSAGGAATIKSFSGRYKTVEKDDKIIGNIQPKELKMTSRDFKQIVLDAESAAGSSQGNINSYKKLKLTQANKENYRDVYFKGTRKRNQQASMWKSAEKRWGTAFEDYVVRKQKTLQPIGAGSYPVDLISDRGRVGEAKFKSSVEKDETLLSKLLRYNIKAKSAQLLTKFTEGIKQKQDTVNVGTIDYYFAGQNKQKFYNWLFANPDVLQNYAVGGKASRKVSFEAGVGPSPFEKVKVSKLGSKIYDLEKSSGLSKYEFDDAVRYAKTNDLSQEEFKNYLSKRAAEKKSKSGLRMNPEDLRRVMLSGTRTTPSTSDQMTLARSLMSDKPDAQYDPKYDNAVRRMLGGRISKFGIGGVAQRRVGYIDYDVIANDANKGIVEAGMKKTGMTGPRLYADYLTQLAVQARKAGDLNKLRAIYGVAGSGKTTLARGQGTDNAKLRQTTRFPILSPEDIQKATDIIVLSSSVSQKKLEEVFGATDRTYTLSSSTKAERDKVRGQRIIRDETGVGLEGRVPGSTSGVAADSAVGEALLADRLGNKSVVLGRSSSGRLRRKSGNELVDVVKKKIGFTWGSFSPMTAGHESIMDSAAAMGISPEDFIYLVGSNEGIKFGDPSSYRTAIFDQDFRVLLGKAGAGSRGATVLPKPRDFEVPQAFDITEDGSDIRRVLVPKKGSRAFVADKTPEQTKKYKESGYAVTNLERMGGISGTMVRDLIMAGNLGELQKVLSPNVYDIVSNNIGRLQNRANALPSIIEQVQKTQGLELSNIEQQIKAVGISRIDSKKVASDPEYAAKVQILQDLRDKRDKIKSAGAMTPYKLLDQLAKSQPEKYGLDLRMPTTGKSITPIRTVKSVQNANIGGIIQQFMAGGAAEKGTPLTLSRTSVQDTARLNGVSIQDAILAHLDQLGGIDGVRRASAIPSGDRRISSILRRNNVGAGQNLAEAESYINGALSSITNREIASQRNIKKSQQKGLLFGAAGILGSPFAPIQKTLSKGLKKPVDVYITSGTLDPKTALRFESVLNNSIDKTTARAAKGVMIDNILAQAGLGKVLQLDFDRTLAFGADKIKSPGGSPFAAFEDPNLVKQGLSSARLSRLGKELVSLAQQRPELLSNMRVITARPSQTAPLIQSWLSSKGLPIPLSQFTAVGGSSVTEAQVAKLKAAALVPNSVFVDDNKENIREAKRFSKANKSKITAYRYGLSGVSADPNREGTTKGNIFERVIESLGGPKALKTIKGIDFPWGLKSAAKYFGIKPNIPTDAKRTLNGPSTVEDNIISYLKAQGFNSGGDVGSEGKFIPAVLTPGEAVIGPKLAKQIGYGKLARMNQADKNGMGKYASGGQVSIVPGSGDTDSFGPVPLEVGSFVIRKRATEALGIGRNFGGPIGMVDVGGMEVQRFATGGMPLRPETISRATVRVDEKAIEALKQLEQVITQLGITGSKISTMLVSAAGVSYKAAEKAAQAEVNRIKLVGGSIDQITQAEKALAGIRSARKEDVAKRNALEGIFGGVSGRSSGEVQQDIRDRADKDAAEKIKKKESTRLAFAQQEQAKQEKDLLTKKRLEAEKTIQSSLEEESIRLYGPLNNTRRANIQNEASKRAIASIPGLSIAEKDQIKANTIDKVGLSDKAKQDIYTRSTINATASVTGKSKQELNNAGIRADDIRKYAQESMMDRKTLRDMDKQLVAMRMQEFKDFGTVRGMAAKSAIQARELAEREVAERRKIVNHMAQQQGLVGPGYERRYTGVGTFGGAFGGVGDRFVGGIRQGVMGVRQSIAQNGYMGAGLKGVSKLGAGVGGQGGFLLSMGVGMLAGQGENIASMMGGSKETQAKRGAGIEAFGSTLASGLSLASGAAMIPGIGPAVAGVTLLGTAAMATVAAFKASAQAQKDYQNSLKSKKAEDAADILARSLKELSKDADNVDLQNKVRQNIKDSVEATSATSGRFFEDQNKIIQDRNTSKMSTSEYIGSFFTPSAYFKTITSKDYGKEDYLDVAKKMSPQFDVAGDAAMLDMEREIKKGTKIDELATAEAFKPLREAIAKANPEVLAQIIQIEQQLANAKDAATRDELTQRKNNIISENTRNSKVLENIKKTDDLNRAMEAASKAGREVAMTFGNMSRSFEQAMGRINFEMDGLGDAANFAIDALSGSAKVGFAKSRDANILQNPSAYSEAERTAASERVSRRLFDVNAAGLAPEEKTRREKQAKDVEKLLNFDTNAFSQQAAGAGNKLLKGKADADIGEVAGEVKKQIEKDIASLPEQVQDEIRLKFESIQKEVEKTEGLTAEGKTSLFLRKIQDELAESTSKAADSVRKMGIDLDNTTSEALNRFANATNRATEAQLKSIELRNKAQDIRTDANIALRELSSGGSIGLNERASVINNRVARLTGGVTDPDQIRQNIEKKQKELSDLRESTTKQLEDKSLSEKQKEDITKKSGEEQANIATEINKNQKALEELANSTELATAAMNQLQRLQQMQADRLANIDQILTSTPQELRKFNESLIRVQQRAMGINPGPSREAQKAYNMTLRQTGGNRYAAMQAAYGQMAQDRATDLRTMEQYKGTYQLGLQNQINPQTGQLYTDEESSMMYRRNAANVRGQMAFESGAIGIPFVGQGIMASVNPSVDPAYAATEQIYKGAIEQQAKANEALAAQETAKKIIALGSATEILAKAFTDITAIFQRSLEENLKKLGIETKDPVVKANGGIVYASLGKFINFQPKGTDTVPAMLTPGEFVVNAKATAQHLPLLKAINSGSDIVNSNGPAAMSKGGIVYLSGGGQARTRADIEANLEAERDEARQIVADVEDRTEAYNAPDNEERMADEEGVRVAIDRQIGASVRTDLTGENGLSDESVNRAASNAARRRYEDSGYYFNGQHGKWDELDEKTRNELIAKEMGSVQGLADRVRSGEEKLGDWSTEFDAWQKINHETIDIGHSYRDKKKEYIKPEERARLGQINTNRDQRLAVQANMGDESATTDRSLLNDLDLVENRQNHVNTGRITNNAVNDTFRAAGIPEAAIGYGPNSDFAYIDANGINWTERMAAEQAKPDFEARTQAQRTIIEERERKLAEERLKKENVSFGNASVPPTAMPTSTPPAQPNGAQQAQQQADQARTESAARQAEQKAPEQPAPTTASGQPTPTDQAKTESAARQTEQASKPQFQMTDAQMYAQQAAAKAPRQLKDFPRPRNMAEVQMYREGLARGMTIQEIKYERQQAYLSRFNPKTRAYKEMSMQRSGDYRPPSERQSLMMKAGEAARRQATGGDPYADQKSGAAQAQEQAQQAKDKAKTDATAQQTEQSDKQGSGEENQPSGADQAQQQAQQAKDKAKADVEAQKQGQEDKKGPQPLVPSAIPAEDQSEYQRLEAKRQKGKYSSVDPLTPEERQTWNRLYRKRELGAVPTKTDDARRLALFGIDRTPEQEEEYLRLRFQADSYRASQGQTRTMSGYRAGEDFNAFKERVVSEKYARDDQRYDKLSKKDNLESYEIEFLNKYKKQQDQRRAEVLAKTQKENELFGTTLEDVAQGAANNQTARDTAIAAAEAYQASDRYKTDQESLAKIDMQKDEARFKETISIMLEQHGELSPEEFAKYWAGRPEFESITEQSDRDRLKLSFEKQASDHIRAFKEAKDKGVRLGGLSEEEYAQLRAEKGNEGKTNAELINLKYSRQKDERVKSIQTEVFGASPTIDTAASLDKVDRIRSQAASLRKASEDLRMIRNVDNTKEIEAYDAQAAQLEARLKTIEIASAESTITEINNARSSIVASTDGGAAMSAAAALSKAKTDVGVEQYDQQKKAEQAKQEEERRRQEARERAAMQAEEQRRLEAERRSKAAIEAEQARQDGMWVNSKQTGVTGAAVRALGWFGGVAESGVRAARGATTAAVGLTLNAASQTGIVDRATGGKAAADKGAELDKKIKEQQARNKEFLGPAGSDPNQALAQAQAAVDAQAATQKNAAGDAFRDVANSAIVAGAQDVANVVNAVTAGKAEQALNSFGGDLGTNVFGRYGDDSAVAQMNDKNRKMLEDMGMHGSAFVTDFANTTSRLAFEAIPIVASFGATGTSAAGKLGQALSYADNLASSPGSLVGMGRKALGSVDNVVLGGRGAKLASRVAKPLTSAGKAAGSAFDFAKPALSVAGRTIGDAMPTFRDVTKGIGRGISDFVGGARMVGDEIMNTLNNPMDALRFTANALDQEFTGGRLGRVATGIANTTRNTSRAVGNTVSSAGRGIVSRANSGITNAVDSLPGARRARQLSDGTNTGTYQTIAQRAEKAKKLKASRASTFEQRIADRRNADWLLEKPDLATRNQTSAIDDILARSEARASIRSLEEGIQEASPTYRMSFEDRVAEYKKAGVRVPDAVINRYKQMQATRAIKQSESGLGRKLSGAERRRVATQDFGVDMSRYDDLSRRSAARSQIKTSMVVDQANSRKAFKTVEDLEAQMNDLGTTLSRSEIENIYRRQGASGDIFGQPAQSRVYRQSGARPSDRVLDLQYSGGNFTTVRRSAASQKVRAYTAADAEGFVGERIFERYKNQPRRLNNVELSTVDNAIPDAPVPVTKPIDPTPSIPTPTTSTQKALPKPSNYTDDAWNSLDDASRQKILDYQALSPADRAAASAKARQQIADEAASRTTIRSSNTAAKDIDIDAISDEYNQFLSTLEAPKLTPNTEAVVKAVEQQGGTASLSDIQNNFEPPSPKMPSRAPRTPRAPAVEGGYPVSVDDIIKWDKMSTPEGLRELQARASQPSASMARTLPDNAKPIGTEARGTQSASLTPNEKAVVNTIEQNASSATGSAATISAAEVKKHLQGPMALPTGKVGDYRYNPGFTSRNEHGLTGWKASLKASGSTPEEIIANNKAIEQWLMTNHKAEFKPYADNGGLFWRAETLGGSATEMEQFAALASKDLGHILDNSFKYADDPNTQALVREFAPGIRGRFDTQQVGLEGKASEHVVNTFKKAQKGPEKLPDGVSVPWNLTTKNILSGAGKQDQAISANWDVRIGAIKRQMAKTTDPAELARLNESLQTEEKALSDLLDKSFPGLYRQNGGLVYANNGALIEARPQGTDTVPAMLTPGEFVINRQAAQTHLPILQAINRGYYNQGGIVQHLAQGGIVAPQYYGIGGLAGMATSIFKGAGAAIGGLDMSAAMEIAKSVSDAVGELKETFGSLENVKELGSNLQQAVSYMGQNIAAFGEHVSGMPQQVAHDVKAVVTHLGNNKGDGSVSLENVAHVATNIAVSRDFEAARNDAKLRETNPADASTIIGKQGGMA